MLKLGILALSVFSFSAFSQSSPYVYVTMDQDAVSSTKSLLNKDMQFIEGNQHASIVKIPAFKVFSLSGLMHADFFRCPGYMVHDSVHEARKYVKAAEKFNKNQNLNRVLPGIDYSIDQEQVVEQFIEQVKESSIVATITKLSSFQNRYYKSTYGVQSQSWIKDYWTSLMAGRNDTKVELFAHANWQQPSVIATIQGSTNPEEIIILGGHADSIQGQFGGNASMRAPGADDNASGIATISEVLRIAMENNYKPARTVMFMAYAAEEVGLLGSKEIAAKFKALGKKVVGVMQMDMTNFKGSAQDILLMSDYSNAAQNAFFGKLIDQYVKVSWGYSRCGYGCSDHASWTLNGFPASIPFEAKMEEYNKNIHTTNDVIAVSGNNGLHAVKFAKLASAYMVEMAK